MTKPQQPNQTSKHLGESGRYTIPKRLLTDKQLKQAENALAIMRDILNKARNAK